MFNMKTNQKVIISLTFLLSLSVFPNFASKLAVLPELNRPSYIAIHNSEVYVLDEIAVKVYSLKDFHLLRQFGCKGNGPGELMPSDEIPLQMQLVNGEVFLNSQTKFIHYSFTGKLLKEKATHFMCMQIIPLGQNYCISRVKFTKKNEIYFNIILYNSDLNPINTIYTSKPTPTIRSRGKIILPPNFTYMKIDSLGERLYLFSGRQADFQILVFGKEGKPLKSLVMKYQPPIWTDTFKKEVISWLKVLPRFKENGINEDLISQFVEFPIHLPAIRNILVEDNQIYVQTYRKAKNNSEFFVFDENSRLVKQVFLPDESRYKVKMNPDITFTVKNDIYYYLVETQDKGDWELHMESVPTGSRIQ